MQTSIENFEALYAELRETPLASWNKDYYSKFDILYAYLNEILSTEGISYNTYFEQETEDLASNAPCNNASELPFNTAFVENHYNDAWFKFITFYTFYAEYGIDKSISPKGLIALGIKTMKQDERIPLALLIEMLYDINLSKDIPAVVKLFDAVLDKKDHEEFILQDILIWMKMVVSEWYEPAFDEVIQKGLNHKYERTVEYFSKISKD